MSLCILNWVIVNTNRGNLIRTCYSETQQDYLIIKLVILFIDDMKICLLNETKSLFFLFFLKLITLFHFSSRRKASISSFVCFWKNKDITLQTLRGKQKYKITNVGVEKIKSSRLLVQHINEFKMNEIQHKTPQQPWPSWQTVTEGFGGKRALGFLLKTELCEKRSNFACSFVCVGQTMFCMFFPWSLLPFWDITYAKKHIFLTPSSGDLLLNEKQKKAFCFAKPRSQYNTGISYYCFISTSG